MNAYVNDRWSWSDSHLNEVEEILKDNARHLMKISIASPDDDRKRAKDLNIEVVGSSIAVRVRNANTTKYRDLTIRSSCPKNLQSELQKIQAGYTDFYIYVWAAYGKVKDWILIDMEAVRLSGLLDIAPERFNNDGSSFIFITAKKLKEYGCIVAGNI